MMKLYEIREEELRNKMNLLMYLPCPLPHHDIHNDKRDWDKKKNLK
jgi:hypothetical protein